MGIKNKRHFLLIMSFLFNVSFQWRWESSQLTGPLHEIPAFAGMTGNAGLTSYAGVTGV